MEMKAPIPGQSLTGAPQNYPWENPPEMTKPDEVMDHFETKMAKPEVKKDIADMLELGMDVATLTEGLVRTGVANGFYSIDVGMQIFPVVREEIMAIGREFQIDVVEELPDEKEKQKRKTVNVAKTKQALLKDTPPLAQEAIETASQIADEGPTKRGFMRKGGK